MKTAQKLVFLVFVASTMSTAYAMEHSVSAAAQDARFQCDQCDFKTNHSGSWNRHERAHQGIRDFVCSACPATFLRKSHLDIHALTHSTEKPFSCKQCGQKFSQKGNCDRHERVAHEGLRPYVCGDCGQGFSQKGNLERHKAVHNLVKDFICAVCDLSCSSGKGLQKHMLLHDPTRKFVCNICGYRFKDGPNMYGHIREIHKKQPSATISVSRARFKKRQMIDDDASYDGSAMSGSESASEEEARSVAVAAPVAQTAMLRLLASVAADEKRKKMPTCHTELYDDSDDYGDFFSSDDELEIDQIAPQVTVRKSPEFQPAATVIADVLQPVTGAALPKKRTKSQPKRFSSLVAEEAIGNEAESYEEASCLVEDITAASGPVGASPVLLPSPVDAVADAFTEDGDIDVADDPSLYWRDAAGHHCTVCGMVFTYPKDIKRHILKHTGKKPFKCPEIGCNKSFQQIGGRKTHVKVAHPDSTWLKEMDAKALARKAKQSISCQFCDQSFTIEASLYRHLRKNHPGEDVKQFLKIVKAPKQKTIVSWYCDDCQRHFDSAVAFDTHYLVVHGNAWTDSMLEKVIRFESTGRCGITCTLCNKKFGSIESIKDHVNIAHAEHCALYARQHATRETADVGVEPVAAKAPAAPTQSKRRKKNTKEISAMMADGSVPASATNSVVATALAGLSNENVAYDTTDLMFGFMPPPLQRANSAELPDLDENDVNAPDVDWAAVSALEERASLVAHPVAGTSSLSSYPVDGDWLEDPAIGAMLDDFLNDGSIT